MGIFHGYVSLPEGNFLAHPSTIMTAFFSLVPVFTKMDASAVSQDNIETFSNEEARAVIEKEPHFGRFREVSCVSPVPWKSTTILKMVVPFGR